MLFGCFSARTAKADKLCCFIMAVAGDSRMVCFCLYGRIEKIWFSMKTVSRSPSMANVLTSVKRTVLSESTVLRCFVVIPLTLSMSFDAKKDG